MKPIATGDTVRLRLPGHTTWSTGLCNGLVGPRSYDIQVGERIYRHNRRQLIEANEPPMPNPTVVDLPPSDQVSSDIEQTASQQTQELPADQSSAPVTSQPCRSGRLTKTPKWMEDYVPS